MSRLMSLRRMIFPHAYRIAWPALGNEIVLLVKAARWRACVTVFDLMGQTRAIFAKTFDFSVYIWAALLYLCLTATFVWIWRQLEMHLSPHIHGRRSSLIGAMLRGREAA